MKQFFKALKGWTWAEVIFLCVVITLDNLSVSSGEGLWATLLFAAICAWCSIQNEMTYKYDFPMNHPDQPVTDQEILGNFIKSILSVFVCVAPVVHGHAWTQIFGVLLAIASIYSVWTGGYLYFKTRHDVKYVD